MIKLIEPEIEDLEELVPGKLYESMIELGSNIHLSNGLYKRIPAGTCMMCIRYNKKDAELEKIMEAPGWGKGVFLIGKNEHEIRLYHDVLGGYLRLIE